MPRTTKIEQFNNEVTSEQLEKSPVKVKKNKKEHVETEQLEQIPVKEKPVFALLPIPKIEPLTTPVAKGRVRRVNMYNEFVKNNYNMAEGENSIAKIKFLADKWKNRERI
jgi:hypothetical protein